MYSQIASYSLLYAEDDQWLAEPIIASLQKDGYEVIYAHDGFDALAKYRRLHPDIILLDIARTGRIRGRQGNPEGRPRSADFVPDRSVRSERCDQGIERRRRRLHPQERCGGGIESPSDFETAEPASEVETDSRYHTAHDAQYDQSRDYHRRRRSQADAERIRVDLPLLPSHERDSRKTGVGRSAVAGKYERKQLPE